jgi:hypothetical protein
MIINYLYYYYEYDEIYYKPLNHNITINYYYIFENYHKNMTKIFNGHC